MFNRCVSRSMAYSLFCTILFLHEEVSQCSFSGHSLHYPRFLRVSLKLRCFSENILASRFFSLLSHLSSGKRCNTCTDIHCNRLSQNFCPLLHGLDFTSPNSFLFLLLLNILKHIFPFDQESVRSCFSRIHLQYIWVHA